MTNESQCPSISFCKPLTLDTSAVCFVPLRLLVCFDSITKLASQFEKHQSSVAVVIPNNIYKITVIQHLNNVFKTKERRL